MGEDERAIDKLIHKYEKYVAPVTFVFGFIFDTLTMKRIDLLFDHIVIISYLLVAGIAIVLINTSPSTRARLRIHDAVVSFAPVFIQFFLS